MFTLLLATFVDYIADIKSGKKSQQISYRPDYAFYIREIFHNPVLLRGYAGY
jgi:hypothetical protein